MVDKWKIALKEFLKEYEEDDDVIGALLCGSYAHETSTINSDIDVQLLLKNDASYKVRGVTECNSFLIEYFFDTEDGIKQRMQREYEEGKNTISRVFGYGKIIYDVEGKVKELQDLGLSYIDKPLITITNNKLNKNNYLIWERHNSLKDALQYNVQTFENLYYVLIQTILDSYCEYIGICKLPYTKAYKILTDEEYRKKHKRFQIPEKKFIELYKNCYEKDKMNIMYDNVTNLMNYYYEKQGGFNIRTFKLKEEL